MKTVLKVVGVILLFTVAAALDYYWLVLKKGWSLWTGAGLLAGLVGLVLAFFFVKRYLLRRREKKFVHRVVQLDDAAISASPLHEREQLLELQEHWKESIKILKESHLRKRGNPLYALPWYVVIGESGSGKTTAIKNSRLNSPVSYQDRATGISATRNCDWWFFKEAIILDTAGRYTIPIDEAKDTEEWERFLVLLAKYRRREPINGVIATVAADKLLAPDRTVLRADGQSIRKRIDQLMRVVGARFPLYILVTKMDLVYGFAETFLGLPEEDTNEAQGYLNATGKMRWGDMIDAAFASMGGRLRNIRSFIVHGEGLPDPGVLLFPGEFQNLRTGLEEFLRAISEDNPYQELPLLRGLYFSSGRQDSKVQPEFFEFTDCKPHDSTKHSSRGLFLRDLFAKVLPADRGLYTRAYEFIRWRRVTNSLGFFSYFLIWAALCGLLVSSFFFNLHTLNRFTRVFAKVPVLTNDMTSDLLILEKFRIELTEVEKANRGWFIPRFGLDASLEAERMGKEHYVDLFNKAFRRQFARTLTQGIDRIDQETDPDVVAKYAIYIIANLSVLNAHLGKEKAPEKDAFYKTSKDLLKILYPAVPEEATATLENIYPAFLVWSNDRAELTRSREILQVALKTLISRRGDLDWLVQKSIPDAPDVLLSDFWGKPQLGVANTAISVSGAYTKAGQEHIEDFIKHLESVITANKALKGKIAAFWNWYQGEYYNAWYVFVQAFQQGIHMADTDALQESLAASMTTDHNPYWQLIDRVVEETTPSGQLKQGPEWVRLIREIKEIRKVASDQNQAAGQTGTKSISAKAEAGITRAEKGLEKLGQRVKSEEDPKEKQLISERPARAKAYNEYSKSLAQIAPAMTSADTCFQMVSDLFAEQVDLSKSKSPFNLTYLNYLSFKNMMTKDTTADTVFVWSLVSGPFEFLLKYGVSRGSCELQKAWDASVLSKVEDTPKEKLVKLLFDKTDGILPKFKEGPAKPFLVSGRYGYSARKAYEKTSFEQILPLRSDFLRFLNMKSPTVLEYKPDYVVRIETIPIAVNDDAPVKPIGNVLTMQCADGPTILYNYNYQDSKTYRWSHEKCGDTSLKILFPGMSLSKTYKGQGGFVDFLSEFRTGSRTFKADEFPDQKGELTRIGVKWIKVKYKIQDALPVLDVVRHKGSTHVQVPGMIVSCSSRRK
jgi:type VI secretion system protein ImpL